MFGIAAIFGHRLKKQGAIDKTCIFVQQILDLW